MEIQFKIRIKLEIWLYYSLIICFENVVLENLDVWFEYNWNEIKIYLIIWY